MEYCPILTNSVCSPLMTSYGRDDQVVLCGFHSIHCGYFQAPLDVHILHITVLCEVYLLLLGVFSRRGRGVAGVRGKRSRPDPLLHRTFPRRCRAAGGRPPRAQQQRLPLLVPLAAGTSAHFLLTGRSNVLSLYL